MKTRFLFLTLLLAFAAVLMAHAERRNVLSLPDITTLTGSSQLPIELENSDEAVAVQFDITLPVGIVASTAAIRTDRLDDHDISVSNISGQRYRVIILSAQNKPFRGQKGVLMYLPVTIPTTFAEGSQHQMSMSNALVISDTGENIITESFAGILSISQLPDLIVNNITTDSESLSPGDHFQVSWQVENIGFLPTLTGWSEQLSLISNDGSTSRILVTTHHDGTLAAGGIVSRMADVILPKLPGIDGTARLQVRIVPDAGSGESSSAQGNNMQTSAKTIYINKVLTLEVNPQNPTENASGRITLKLNRSGNWSKRETFDVTTTSDSRLRVPETLTILEGQSGVVAYMTIEDNELLDADSVINISVTGNGYTAVTQRVVIEDDELPTLTLSAQPAVISEGDTLLLSIGTIRPSDVPLTVTLKSENNTRFMLPAQAIIPAGETSVTVKVVANNDDLPSLDLSNAFTASAPGYNHGQALVILKDDDLPLLELTLTPSTVSEGAGAVAVAGTLRRITNTKSKITLKLSDDAAGGLFFPTQTLILDKGVTETNFNFGPIDNNQVDGDRTYTITAAVWIASCSCHAGGESAGTVSTQLRVLDDDGPALRLSAATSVLNEGGQTTLTVGRNTQTDEPVTLQLSSDGDDRLLYDHEVTIPAGSKEMVCTITAIKNADEGDTRNIVFTAQADGFARSTCWLTLSDKTMADAQVLNVSVKETSIIAGDTARITVRIGNTGTAPLPSQTAVTFYVDGAATPVLTAWLQEALQPSKTVTLERDIPIPATVGTHRIQVAVNADKRMQELNYTNNVSSPLSVTLQPPFSATASVGKAVYEKGESVCISGSVSGRNVSGREVEVYVLNSGYRHAISVTTDANGHFETSYLPFEGQVGHFAVGACFPSEGITTEMTSFEMLGLKRTSRNAVTADFHIDETATGAIGLQNPSRLPLTGVTVKAVDVPEGCHLKVSCPQTIAGEGMVNITYSIGADELSPGNDWQVARIEVTTAEGPSLTIPLYYYCRNNRGQLQPNIYDINTTLNIYSSREYPFTITNIGKGETGAITLALPSWMSTVTPAIMPSLKQGETAHVVLLLSPSDQMKLNVPVTGQIGVNCENGNGFALPYSVEPVSQTNGMLIIDACDENTYNTTEKPHLQEATVVVTHPATGAIVAQGVTGVDGIFRQELPEGHYGVKVTAEKHDTYQNNIIISPAQDNDITVNLSLQAITVNWNVVETEVVDEYRIETTVEFETNVPVPAVVLSAPNSVDGDNLKPGESLFIPVTLTNKGLIRAENVQLFLPEASDEWEIKAISDAGPMTLEPEESVNIALMLVRKQGTKSSRFMHILGAPEEPTPSPTENIDALAVMNECFATISWFYSWYCGETLKSNAALYRFAIKACATAQLAHTYLTNAPIVQGLIIYSNNNGNGGTGSTIWDALGGTCPGAPNGDEGSRYDFTENYSNTAIGQGTFFCDPCRMAMAEAVVNTVIGFAIPVAGVCNSIADMAINANKDGHVDPVDVASVGMSAAGIASRNVGIASLAVTILDVLRTCFDGDNDTNGEDDEETDDEKEDEEWITTCGYPWPLPPTGVPPFPGPGNLPAPPSDPWNAWGELRIYNNVARKYYNQLRVVDKVLRQIVVSRVWYESGSEDFLRFFDAMKEQGAEGELIADLLMAYKPEAVSKEEVEFVVERINNSYVGSTVTNRINIDSLAVGYQTIQDYDREAQDNGYATMGEWYDAALDELKADLSGGSSSVCSSVTIQFSQTMVMTRQAFRGTLTIHNGHDTEAMKDIHLNLTISDENGIVATEREFQTNMESLTGFVVEASLDGDWTLDAQGDGVATVLFIPSKYAAQEKEKAYDFGGTLTYTDPFTGLEVTRQLNPVRLTVKPSPELDLTYFMQRDILGDDPLTEEVEPTELAEFAILISNKGYGDAANVSITTAQPTIIRNEKGLKDSLVIVSSQLNGEDKLLPMSENNSVDFGNIAAHSTAYAQWWLQNSLLGHFTSYDVKATHVLNDGNPNLSLLDQVTIHELIHGFTPATATPDGLPIGRAFLCNDIEDALDLPDQVYFTDGTQQDVMAAKTVNLLPTDEEAKYELHVTGQPGWLYGSLFEPTGGKQQLVKAVRKSDGTELPLDNFWQTDRTLRDGKDPLYEYRLHFVVNMAADDDKYILTFKQKPEAQQTLTMTQGWNWLSIYLSEEVGVQEFTAKTDRLLSQTQELFFDPEYGIVGGIHALYPGVAYKLLARETFVKTFGGNLYDAAASPFSMKKGWNWVGYPCPQNADITVIANAEEGDFLVGQTGYAEYTDNDWVGTLTTLMPGQGYLYKSARDKPLTFDLDAQAATRAVEYPMSACSSPMSIAAANYQLSTINDLLSHRYPSTMNITARLWRDGEELTGDGWHIYAMSGDELRGVSEQVAGRHYLTVYGDHPVVITFFVENTEAGDSFAADELLEFRSDVVGSHKAPFAITIGSATDICPFAHSVVSLNEQYYDLAGRKISSPTHGNTILKKGVYIVNGRKRVVK